MATIQHVLEAIETNHFPGICTLAEKVSFINRANEYGETALMSAAASGNCALIEKLLAQGASIDCRDEETNTPLMWALYRGQKEAARMLIESEANLKARNWQGRTAFMIAAMHGFTDLLDTMLFRGDPEMIDEQDNQGNTALILAATYGHNHTVHYLLLHGSDGLIRNYFGNTALTIATRKKHTDVIKSLFEHHSMGISISTEHFMNLAHGDIQIAEFIKTTVS
jgi:ankyrin repeat protein